MRCFGGHSCLPSLVPALGATPVSLPCSPRKSTLWLMFSGLSFPGLPSCAVAAIALSGEVAELPSLRVLWDLCVGNREPQKGGKWVVKGPALSTGYKSYDLESG